MNLPVFIKIYSLVNAKFPTALEYMKARANLKQLEVTDDPSAYYVLLNGNNRYALKKLGGINWVSLFHY